jgi:hypothetical protein
VRRRRLMSSAPRLPSPHLLSVGGGHGQEVVVHALSFVANARDLCSVSLVRSIIACKGPHRGRGVVANVKSLGAERSGARVSVGVQTCRALAAISRDDGLWKPLGHPSWADHQVAYAPFLSLHSIPDSCMMT